MTIEIDNLRIRFGEREVVKGVSFQVEEGGSFGIVGESGSGKSTVLRAMAGLNTSWAGRIAFNGEAAPQHRTPDFFRKVQMVFQDPYGSLHPRQTIDRILSELPLVSHFCDRVAVMYSGRVMEEIKASELLSAAHPYTRGLLNCIPSLTHPKERLPILERDPEWLK